MATRDELLFARPHGMRPRNDLVRRDANPFLGRVREGRRCPRLSLSLEDEGDLTANAPEDPRDGYGRAVVRIVLLTRLFVEPEALAGLAPQRKRVAVPPKSDSDLLPQRSDGTTTCRGSLRGSAHVLRFSGGPNRSVVRVV
jgi:hypothetical protein